MILLTSSEDLLPKPRLNNYSKINVINVANFKIKYLKIGQANGKICICLNFHVFITEESLAFIDGNSKDMEFHTLRNKTSYSLLKVILKGPHEYL